MGGGKTGGSARSLSVVTALTTSPAAVPAQATTKPDWRALAVVAIGGLGFDLAVRSGVAGFGGALLVMAVAVGVLASGRIENRLAWPLLGAAPLFGIWLAIRMSPWLLPFDILAAGGLLALGAVLGRDGDPTDLTVPNLMERGLHLTASSVLAPAVVIEAGRSEGGGRSWGAVLRGALLAAPIVGIAAVLLASADAVFASAVRVPTEPDQLIGHLVLVTVGAWGAAALLRTASVPSTIDFGRQRPVLGGTEAVVVLAALAVVYLAFAVSQVVVLAGGARHVIETAGLTYAEYARSGFFQLVAVTALTVGLVLALRAAADLTEPSSAMRFRITALAVIGLTLVIVVVAVRRLHLYEVAFGMTMLRLYATCFVLWVGGVLGALGLSAAGVGRGRAWVVPAALGMGLAGLLFLNVVNPEAFVARRNIARGGEIDSLYLSELGDDAVPVVADALTRRVLVDQYQRDRICAMPSRATGGFWSYNGSRDAAIEARNQLCATPPRK